MNAFCVVCDNFVLPSCVAYRGLVAFTVTARAKGGHIGGEGQRSWILFAQHSMRTVAFLAVRSIGIILAVQLSMRAAYVLFANFLMARRAVHSVGDGLARPYARGVYFRVALATGNFGVTRMVHLSKADEHGLPVSPAAQLLICVAVHAIRIGHSLGVENIPDFVRLMAIDAGGQDVCLFFPQFAANNFAVHGFDLRVAFGAGGGNIPAIDRRSGVGMRQDQVRSVAGRAIWSYCQSLLQQSLSMDTLGVVLQNIVLVNGAVALNRSSLAMALTANDGDFQRCHRRPWILY